MRKPRVTVTNFRIGQISIVKVNNFPSFLTVGMNFTCDLIAYDAFNNILQTRFSNFRIHFIFLLFLWPHVDIVPQTVINSTATTDLIIISIPAFPYTISILTNNSLELGGYVTVSGPNMLIIVCDSLGVVFNETITVNSGTINQINHSYITHLSNSDIVDPEQSTVVTHSPLLGNPGESYSIVYVIYHFKQDKYFLKFPFFEFVYYRIWARDRFQNSVTNTSAIQFTVVFSNVSSQYTDFGNGYYGYSVSSNSVGDYSVAIISSGVNITGSPLIFLVSSGIIVCGHVIFLELTRFQVSWLLLIYQQFLPYLLLDRISLAIAWLLMHFKISNLIFSHSQRFLLMRLRYHSTIFAQYESNNGFSGILCPFSWFFAYSSCWWIHWNFYSFNTGIKL